MQLTIDDKSRLVWKQLNVIKFMLSEDFIVIGFNLLNITRECRFLYKRASYCCHCYVMLSVSLTQSDHHIKQFFRQK